MILRNDGIIIIEREVIKMIVERIKNVYLTKEEKNFIEKFWGFLADNELAYDDITTIMNKLCTTDLTEIKRPTYNIIIK